MKSTSWAKPTTGRRTKTLGRSWRKLGFRFAELLCACLSLSTGAAKISEPWRGPTYKNFSKAASPTLTSGSLNKNSGSFRFYSNVSHERLFDVAQISFETTRNWDSHHTQWQICFFGDFCFFCQWLATPLTLSRSRPCKNATSTAWDLRIWPSLEIWHRPPECLKTPMQTTKNLQVESVSNSRHVLVCQRHQELPQHLGRSMYHVAWIEVEWASHGVGIAWHHLACHLDFFQLSVTALKHLTHTQIQLRALCQKECRSTAKKINSPEALTVWIKHNSSWSTSALMSFSGLRRSAPWLLLHFFVHQNLHAISLLHKLLDLTGPWMKVHIQRKQHTRKFRKLPPCGRPFFVLNDLWLWGISPSTC